ncbi:MAG: hypothetical protein ACOX6K_02950 [Sphaerochaetaceae bacterium]|jgi:hypothetical protein
MIDLRKHSSRHLETKLILPIPESRGYTRDIHYYIFSPAQLHLAVIPEHDMLRKFQSHGRYSSPEITLDELFEPSNALSPLVTLRRYVERRLQSGSFDVSEMIVIHELQALANSVRHDCRVEVQDCKELVEDSRKTGRYEDLIQSIDEWCVLIRKLLDELRDMMDRLKDKLPADNRVLSAFSWADETISILIEHDSLDMYLAAEPLFGKLGSSPSRLLKISRSEANYRMEKGYLSSAAGNVRNTSETVAYRQGVLKKWSQSVLYLTPQYSRWPKRIGGILAGAAAAIAMTFATIASIFAETWFLKNSLQWALIVIIAYVFKDRIKEGLRAFFNKVLPKMMADEIFSFVSPRTGRKICTNKVMIDMTDAKNVPSKIAELRRDRENLFQDMLPTEDVLHYTRYIFMHKPKKNKNDFALLPWINNLTLITRIRIDDWLKEMDDPKDIVYRIDPNADEFDQMDSERVYHLHMVIEEYSKEEGIDDLSHYRIILNKTGIIRIEKLYSSDD